MGLFLQMSLSTRPMCVRPKEHCNIGLFPQDFLRFLLIWDTFYKRAVSYGVFPANVSKHKTYGCACNIRHRTRVSNTYVYTYIYISNSYVYTYIYIYIYTHTPPYNMPHVDIPQSPITCCSYALYARLRKDIPQRPITCHMSPYNMPHVLRKFPCYIYIDIPQRPITCHMLRKFPRNMWHVIGRHVACYRALRNIFPQTWPKTKPMYASCKMGLFPHDF